MRCIFCKQDSTNSTSVEHIVPESLGNYEHILPPGMVCDRCNNYLGRAVEKPVLESEYLAQVRFINSVVNKRGGLPTIRALHVGSATQVEIYSPRHGGAIYPVDEKDTTRFVRYVSSAPRLRLVLVPRTSSDQDQYLLSRFLGKTAIEALAHRLLGISQALEELIDSSELDPLRTYVRNGSQNLLWPFHSRQIYPIDAVFHENGYGQYQVLHEWTFIYMPSSGSQELYFVLAIFGVEYALNLEAPNVDAYKEWLTQNGDISPLYPDGAPTVEQ
jgi:hypothetical protein